MRSDGFSNGFVWIGIVASALATVKALNTFLDFGFKGVWAEVLEYYSKATEPLRELIARVPYLSDLPSWLPDVIVLYFVLVLAGLRSTVLPLRYDDYYTRNNTRRVYTKSFPRKDEEDFNDFLERQNDFGNDEVMQAEVGDNHFEVHFREVMPKWEVIFRQSLKCLSLWPVITLEPLRKMYGSIKFVREMLKKSNQGDEMIEYEAESGKGYYARWALEVDKIRIDGFLQIISLPLLVILFLLGATYLT